MYYFFINLGFGQASMENVNRLIIEYVLQD